MTNKRSSRQYWGKTDLTLPEIDLTSVQKESYQHLILQVKTGG